MNLKITIADVFSFLGLLLGFIAMIYIFEAKLHLASVMLVITALIDYLDGKVARHFECSNEFGKNIDSLCDLFSFGAVPSIFLSMYLKGYFRFVAFFILLAGVYRLARYNIIKQEKYYIGMPITMNVIIPVFYLSGILTQHVAILLSILLPVLMVSKIKFKKIV